MNTTVHRNRVNSALLVPILIGMLASLSAVARNVNEPDDTTRRRPERSQAPAAAPAPQTAPGSRPAQRGAPINPVDGSPPRNAGANWQRGENRGGNAGSNSWSGSDRYGSGNRSYNYGSYRNRPLYGSTIRALPPGYTRYGYRNDDYYFHNGLWYRPFGGYYTIARPPRGIVIYTLPPYYTSLWFGGVRYYYADDVYYRWDDGNRGYVVSDPPVEDEPGTDELYVYPTRGQSTEQQAKDRYECYRWAADQTGFDPTQPEGGTRASDTSVRPDDYRRAEAACLEGRGYNVK
jgi:hypothetical protein